jgi:hypothetical protein
MHAMLGHSMLLLVQLRFRQRHYGRVRQSHKPKHERNRYTHEGLALRRACITVFVRRAQQRGNKVEEI